MSSPGTASSCALRPPARSPRRARASRPSAPRSAASTAAGAARAPRRPGAARRAAAASRSAPRGRSSRSARSPARRRRGRAARQPLGGLRLDDHDAHVVGDQVVQVARDPRALGRDGGGRARLAVGVDLERLRAAGARRRPRAMPSAGRPRAEAERDEEDEASASCTADEGSLRTIGSGNRTTTSGAVRTNVRWSVFAAHVTGKQEVGDQQQRVVLVEVAARAARPRPSASENPRIAATGRRRDCATATPAASAARTRPATAPASPALDEHDRDRQDDRARTPQTASRPVGVRARARAR